MKHTYEILLLSICIIFYFIYYSVFISGDSYDIEVVSYTEINLSIFGFFVGLWMSSFLHRTIFNDEKEDAKNIWKIIIIGIISIIITCSAVVSVVYNVKGISSMSWIKYHQILFPLYGGFLLISEEAVRHFIHYILSEKKYETSFRKLPSISTDSSSLDDFDDSNKSD